jgi:hypothetical protein
VIGSEGDGFFRDILIKNYYICDSGGWPEIRSRMTDPETIWRRKTILLKYKELRLIT